MRELRAGACFAFPWRKFENAQVCRAAANGVADEPYKSTIHKLQVQPNEQPNAEEFGGEVA
jgi:hypothetical protein